MTDHAQVAQSALERLNRLEKETSKARRLAKMLLLTAGVGASADAALVKLRDAASEVAILGNDLRSACFSRTGGAA